MTTTEHTMRYLGVTDACTDCEKCGKPNLRSTVVLQPLDADGNFDGDPVYYGSTCAARALAVKGGGRVVLARARSGHHDTLTADADARRMLAFYGLPVAGDPTAAELDRAATVYAEVHGNSAWAATQTDADWLRRAADMLTRKRAAIAAADLVEPVCSFCGFAHRPRQQPVHPLVQKGA